MKVYNGYESLRQPKEEPDAAEGVCCRKAMRISHRNNAEVEREDIGPKPNIRDDLRYFYDWGEV